LERLADRGVLVVEPFEAETGLELSLASSVLEGMGLPSLPFERASATCQARATTEQISLQDVSLALAGFSYGDYAPRDDAPVSLEGDLSIELAPFGLRGSETEILLEKGTVLSVDSWGFPSFSPLEFDIALDLVTDLAPLVTLGYLGAASGTASGSARARYADEGFELNIDSLRTAGLDLALPESFAEFVGSRFCDVAMSLEARYDSRQQDALCLDYLKARGSIEDVDLSLVTQLHSVFDVVLTGKAAGDFEVFVESGILRSFVLRLETGEGFSMNRKPLWELLEFLLNLTEWPAGVKLVPHVPDVDPVPINKGALSVELDGELLRCTLYLYKKGFFEPTVRVLPVRVPPIDIARLFNRPKDPEVPSFDERLVEVFSIIADDMKLRSGSPEEETKEERRKKRK